MSPSTVPVRAGTAWPLLATGAAITAYSIASHLLMVHAAQQPWAVAVLFGPLVAAVAGGAWAQRQWALLLLCAAGVAALATVVAHGGVADMQRLYVLQHGGIHLALATAFGHTLRAGRTPLITAMAMSVHQHFTPALAAYTRRLTQLWVAYFLGMVALSLAVYALAPWPWWSVFGNLLTPLAAATLFVGEYLLRYWRHPEFERVTLRSALEAYRARERAR